MFQVTSSWKESVTFFRVLERNTEIIRITKISWEVFLVKQVCFINVKHGISFYKMGYLRVLVMLMHFFNMTVRKLRLGSVSHWEGRDHKEIPAFLEKYYQVLWEPSVSEIYVNMEWNWIYSIFFKKLKTGNKPNYFYEHLRCYQGIRAILRIVILPERVFWFFSSHKIRQIAKN